MAAARKGWRRGLSTRIEPKPNLQAVPRLQAQQPHVQGTAQWMGRIQNGFYTLWLEDTCERFPFLAVRAAKEHWVLPLTEVPGRGFALECFGPQLMCDMLQPIGLAVPAPFLLGDPVVVRLRLEVGKIGETMIELRIAGRELVQAVARKRRTCHTEGSEETSSSEGELSDDDCFEVISSYCSGFGSDGDVSEGSDRSLSDSSSQRESQSNAGDSDIGLLRARRLPPGSHTVWPNAYFYLTDNRKYPDVRMTLRAHWRATSLLGARGYSKTLVPEHFGDDRAQPDNVFLVLRAWMLWRMKQRGFLLTKRGRLQARPFICSSIHPTLF